MARRLPSPTGEELERINEILEGIAKFQIQDRDSYDLAFNDYMGDNAKNFKDSTVTEAFNLYLKDNPEVSEERLFSKAGGKGRDRGLRKDRETTAKRIVDTRKEFIKETAPKVDLRGFDTIRQKTTKELLRRRTFTIPTKVKGRVVFAKKDFVTVRGKKQLRFRDSKGRFASAKK